MAKNMFQLTGRIDPKSFKEFRRKFGESSKAGLLRVAVFAAREAAAMTRPPGTGRKQIIGAIEAGARAVCSPVKPKTFKQILKTGTTRRGRGGRFFKLPASKILKGSHEISKFIDRQRGSDGRTIELSLEQKAACKKTDYTKALAARKRRAGRAKGAWLGAGIAVSRIGGGERIGKGFMKWAQKHKEEGTARFRHRILDRSEVTLINRVHYSGKLFSRAAGREAARKAWKKGLAWYKRAVKLAAE